MYIIGKLQKGVTFTPNPSYSVDNHGSRDNITHVIYVTDTDHPPCLIVPQNEPSTPSGSATSPKFKHAHFHQRLSSKVPHTSTTLFRDSAHVEAANEMKGKFWGPVPVPRFFDEFLNVETPRMPTVRYSKFVHVASRSKEPDMYAPLVRCFFCNHKVGYSLALL